MSGLTDKQRAASRPEASIWVSASAGTGKTHVLTARVLRLLLRGVPPEQLLCLTFTKAAAAEMANRLRDTLGRWTTLANSDLANDILKSCGANADAAMLELAPRLFAHVLDLSDGLKIQTIHSFCQALLARFPLEAGIAPHFEVMDEDRAQELLGRARDHVIDQARKVSGKTLHQALSTIAQEVNEQDFDKLTSNLMLERRLLGDLLSRAAYGSLDGLKAAVRRTLGVADYPSEETYLRSALGDSALPLTQLRHFLAAVKTAGSASEKRTLHPALAAICNSEASDRAALWPSYKAIFLTGKNEPRKLSRYPTKDVKAQWDGLVPFMEDEIERVLSIDETSKLIRAAGFAEAALTLGAAILEAYDAEKKKEGVLDYSDLILGTERLLDMDGISPWILYKLDAGISHILVDEAQDTNPEQWRVIEALTEDFFAGDTARDIHRTVFAVGDVKQSIYGFQRADPREFIHARDRFRERTGAVGHPFETVPLDLSFRSTEAVLSLVDAVFADPDMAKGLSIDGSSIHHEAFRTGDAGLVELWPLEPTPHAPPREDWEPPLVQEASDSADARLAVRIARHIKDMLDRHEELPAKSRPIRPGDIMVLVRRRTEFVDHLIKALKLVDVPVAGSDRMKVTSQLAVMDMLVLAQVALLPEDDLALATVLKGPMVGLDEETLFTLAHNRGKASLWSRLTQQALDTPALAKALSFLEDVRRMADQVSPFRFFASLLTERGGRRALIARLGPEATDPLDELLHLAQDYERDNPPSLQGFLKWIERGGAEIKRDLDQGRNEVRILTVHGAKGLQAPIVFLPDCGQAPSDKDSLFKLVPAGPTARPDLPLLVWRGNKKDLEVGPVAKAREEHASRQDEEFRRLLYVALTRAEDRLYIAGWQSLRQSSMPTWHDLVQQGFERLDHREEITDAGGRTIIRLSCPQTRPVERAVVPTQPQSLIDLPKWLRLPPATEAAPVRPLTPSRPDVDDPPALSPLISGAHNRYQRGILIHRLLELLPDIPCDRREQAARQFLSRPAHDLAPETIDIWWSEVAAILEHPDFSVLFGPESTAEAPITGLVGTTAIRGQVDRLAVTKDGVYVVDYKTNRPPPQDADMVSHAYLRQMAAYRALLRQIYPGRPVICALLWTDGPRMMALPDSLLDPLQPDHIYAP